MTMLPLALAASLFFSYGPSSPTVGDPVTIDYRLEQGARIVPDQSDAYEIVSSDGGTLVVRSFRPGPFTVQASVESDGVSEPFRGPTVEVGSVLAEGDSLEPAPLKPPVVPPRTRLPFVAIAGATAAAALAWAALLLMKRRPEVSAAHVLSLEETYINRLQALRSRPFEQRTVAEVAELVREFLSANDSALARELTSRELVERVRQNSGSDVAVPLSEVLREGDLAKFSPWGSHFGAMGPLVDRAESLVRGGSAAGRGPDMKAEGSA